VAETDLYLFVSHVSEDRAAAMEIVAELEQRGIKCWIAPRNVRPGSRFDDEISDAIDDCRALLLIFSDRCNESDYILREIHAAGESQKTVIPFRIENVHPRRGLRIRLSDLHWIDGFAERERAIGELTQHLGDPAAAARRREREANDVLRRRQEAEVTQAGEAATPVPTPVDTRRPTAATDQPRISRKPVVISLALAAAVIVLVLGLMFSGVLPRKEPPRVTVPPPAPPQAAPPPAEPAPPPKPQENAAPTDRGPDDARGHSLWAHNGSVVYLVANGSAREFYYHQPRPGMLGAGARPGSLLFWGRFADMSYIGTAYIFNARCGRFPYAVTGPVLDGYRRVVLKGDAPRIGTDCQIVDHVPDTLEFTLTGNAN
jgi:hypothetical protein